MFCRFWTKISVSGNRCHTLIFKDKDNQKILVCSEKNGLTKLLSRFFEIFEILRFFSTFVFYFCKKKSLKLPNFQKTGIFVLAYFLNNLCNKFQLTRFRNIVFIAFLMSEMATFQGIWAWKMPWIEIDEEQIHHSWTNSSLHNQT